MNFQIFKLDLEKAEEPETTLPTSIGSSKKREFQKKIYFCFIDYAKPLTVWITTNCGKFLKRWEYQTTYLPLEKSVCKSGSILDMYRGPVRSGHGTKDWFQIGK